MLYKGALHVIIIADIMENNEKDQKPSVPSGQPMQPPPQPLDTKKSGVPMPVILFVVVFGFALAAAAFALLSRKPAKKGQGKARPVPETKAVPQTIMEVVEPEQTEESLLQESAVEKPLPTLSLSGILLSKKGSLALINGRIVPEGETVAGAKVMKVGSDTVELDFEGKKIILRSR
jgi:hypothetical protein